MPQGLPYLVPNVNAPLGFDPRSLEAYYKALRNREEEALEQQRLNQFIRERLPLEFETQQEAASLQNRILQGRLSAFEKFMNQRRINTRPTIIQGPGGRLPEDIEFQPSVPGAQYEAGGQTFGRGVYRNRPTPFEAATGATPIPGAAIPSPGAPPITFPEQQTINTQPTRLPPSTSFSQMMGRGARELLTDPLKGTGELAKQFGRQIPGVRGFAKGFREAAPPQAPSGQVPSGATRNFADAYTPSPAFQQGVNESVTQDMNQLINTGPIQPQVQSQIPQQQDQQFDQNQMDYILANSLLSGDFGDYSRTVAELVRYQIEAMQEQGLDRRSILNAAVQMANNQLDADSSRFSALAGMAGNAQTLGAGAFGLQDPLKRNAIQRQILSLLGLDVSQGQTGLGPVRSGIKSITPIP